MDVRNCPRCGSIFLYCGFRLCENCKKIEDEEFETVKAYLKDNPGTTVEKVAADTGVSRQQILFFIRSGRLSEEAKSLSGNVLFCERCEKPISQGKLCLTCQKELTQTFLKAQTKSKEQKVQKDTGTNKKAKVHFLDKSRDNK